MIPAVFVGFHGRSGALLALTESDAIEAGSFKRLLAGERFFASELEKVKGSPWDLELLETSGRCCQTYGCWSRHVWVAYLADPFRRRLATTDMKVRRQMPSASKSCR